MSNNAQQSLSATAQEQDSPFVVASGDIPLSSAPTDVGFQVRPYSAHPRLGPAVPASAVGLAAIHVRGPQDVGFRSHPIPSLLIVLQGRAELLGTLRRSVQQGDVITVPSHHSYSLIPTGPEGLEALEVTFPQDATDSPSEALSLDYLLERNDSRARAILETPYFRMLRTRALESNEDRARFRDRIRVFSDAFQTFLFTRQAMCRDDEFWNTFHGHLVEELGHNKLLTVTNDERAESDPILQATSSWFSHQMIVLDNLGKAVVNIVLETAGYHFHSLAKAVFAEDESAPYFNLHAEGDEQHKDVGRELLQDQHPLTYRYLCRVLDDSWDMLEAMTGRIVHLIGLERTGS